MLSNIEILSKLQALSLRAIVGIDRVIVRSSPLLPIKPTLKPSGRTCAPVDWNRMRAAPTHYPHGSQGNV